MTEHTWDDCEVFLRYVGPEPQADFDARVAKYIADLRKYSEWAEANKDAIAEELAERERQAQAKKLQEQVEITKTIKRLQEKLEDLA